MESYCAEQARSIQQSHAEDMQHLKMVAIEEEGRDHIFILAACETALQACSQKAMGY